MLWFLFRLHKNMSFLLGIIIFLVIAISSENLNCVYGEGVDYLFI